MERVFFVVSKHGKRKTVKILDPDGCTYGELKICVERETEFPVEPNVAVPIPCVPDDDDICCEGDGLYFKELVEPPGFGLSLASHFAATANVTEMSTTASQPQSSTNITDLDPATTDLDDTEVRTVDVNDVSISVSMFTELSIFAKQNQKEMLRVYVTYKPLNPIFYLNENIYEFFNSVLIRSAVVLFKSRELHQGYVSTLRHAANHALYNAYKSLSYITHKGYSARLKDLKALYGKVNECFHLDEVTVIWIDKLASTTRANRARNKLQKPDKPGTPLPISSSQLSSVEEVANAAKMTSDSRRLSELYRDNAEIIAKYMQTLHSEEYLVDGSTFKTMLEKFPSLTRNMSYISETYQIYMRENYGNIPHFGDFIKTNAPGILSLAKERKIDIPTSTDATFSAAVVLPEIFKQCMPKTSTRPKAKTSKTARSVDFILHSERIVDIHSLKKDAEATTTAPKIVAMSSRKDPKYFIVADGTDLVLDCKDCATAVQLLFEVTFLLNLEYDENMRAFCEFLETAAGLTKAKKKKTKGHHEVIIDMIRQAPPLSTTPEPTESQPTSPATPSRDLHMITAFSGSYDQEDIEESSDEGDLSSDDTVITSGTPSATIPLPTESPSPSAFGISSGTMKRRRNIDEPSTPVFPVSKRLRH